jgi:predicted ABC-type ATPase
MLGVPGRTPRIIALAGTNGAGKSSVSGAHLREQGVPYFNPDEEAREIFSRNPDLGYADANSKAWEKGRDQLETAIRNRSSFNFETTLGGTTITNLLIRAARNGHEVWIWYVGLVSPELHLERIRARVSRGGHDIPEDRVRARYDSSRQNLIRLLPHVTELRLWDNSKVGDPQSGEVPLPQLLLHFAKGEVSNPVDLDATPEWARDIVRAAMAIATQP